MAKSSPIGGIYNKPIAVGNFMHFGVAAIALFKIVFEIEVHAESIISLTIVYSIFALCFVYAFINNPRVLSK
jgi:LytS/YehU family sensor histidine kinase